MNRFTPEQLIAKGYKYDPFPGQWVKDIQKIIPKGNKAPDSIYMPKATPQPSNTPTTPQKGRLRQNTTGLNKTEQAFKAALGREFHPDDCRIYDQSITLKIANGCRYTPDFMVAVVRNGGMDFVAYEVKGFMRDDAAVKLKVAAALYPWIEFNLVTRKKGLWNVQKILP